MGLEPGNLPGWHSDCYPEPLKTNMPGTPGEAQMNLKELKNKSLEIRSNVQHRVSEQLRSDKAERVSAINVGRPERIISGVLGSALLLLGMRRPGITNRLVSLAGADLLLRGASGCCNVYKALNFSTVSEAEKTARHIPGASRFGRKTAA